LGARFSGAGFRGCCIGLADASVEEDPQFRSSVLQSYLEQHPDMESEAEIFFCRSADGAGLL
jgi:galactokinase/galacturonokinase